MYILVYIIAMICFDLKQVISLVGWLNLVKSFFFFNPDNHCQTMYRCDTFLAFAPPLMHESWRVDRYLSQYVRYTLNFNLIKLD